MQLAVADPGARVKYILGRSIDTSEFPGIQYIAVDPHATLFEYFGGWADIAQQRPMQPTTTMMAYSITKTFSAAAVLQLMERRKLRLDDAVTTHIPYSPYGNTMTIRHLLSQTSGIPNPIPLRWVHLSGQHASFDEDAALHKVLADHSRPAFPPGEKYAYANISFWLLGKIVERVSGMPFTEYMKKNVFSPLGLTEGIASFSIPDLAHHAKGYLAKYSFMNLGKRFLIGNEFIGDYEGRWLHINDHYPNGAAYGGIVCTARSVATFLQDQLRDASALFNRETKELFYEQQKTSTGKNIAMTLGWHIRMTNNKRYYYKEGGGGGYHGEMRMYNEQGIASVIMTNETSSRCTNIQSDLDKEFLR